MENIQNSSIITDGSDESNNESSISNNFESDNNISFINDEDSRMVLIGECDKIIELQNAEKYLDKELSVTEKAVKPLFVQYIALQRHTLRRHLKTCRTTIKDLEDLVEALNEETVPSKSLIQEELQLWTQELNKTYDQILKLKRYFLEAIARAEVLDYSMIRNTPLFVTDLKNTRSVLHNNFEFTYKYISDVHKMQKTTTSTMEDIIKQYEVFKRLTSKIMEILPMAGQLIVNLGIENSYNIDRHIDIPFNPLNQSSTSTSNLFVIPEENLPPQQSNDE